MPLDVKLLSKYDQFQVTEVDSGIVHVAINRPHLGNSWDPTAWHQLRDLLHSLDSLKDDNSPVKVIILTGNGKHFSTGLNIEYLQQQSAHLYRTGDPVQRKTETYNFIRDFQDSVGAPAQINVPIIAVSQGINFGLALDLLSGTSIRLATKNAVFALPEVKLGFAADVGSLQRLSKLVNNQSVYNELIYTGRLINADQAKHLGLVSEVFANKEEAFGRAVEIAKEIAQWSKAAIAGTKDSATFIYEGGSVRDGLDRVARYNAEFLPPANAALVQRIKKSNRAKL